MERTNDSGLYLVYILSALAATAVVWNFISEEISGRVI